MSRASRVVRSVAVASAVLAVPLTVSGAAQDKYSLTVPNGPAFSEIRGYEEWPVVAVSYPQENGMPQLKIILANPTMIAAYKAGVHESGKAFPQGSKIVKLVYSPKPNPAAPYTVAVPDKLLAVAFIEKDNARFADTGGWGYGEFGYDPASDTFKAGVEGHNCGAACHQGAKPTDFIFTAYPKR
jgi:hypothetical protein